jgi:phage gp29-like protein
MSKKRSKALVPEMLAASQKPPTTPLFQGATVQDRNLILIGMAINKALINSYLYLAQNGDMRRLSAFKREMLSDPFLSGEINKIKSKLISSPITFSTFPSNLTKPSVANTTDAKRAFAITDYIKRQLLDSSDLLRQAISDLWYGLEDGVAVIEIVAEVRNGEVCLKDLITVPQERICYDPDDLMTLGVQLTEDPSDITPLDQLGGNFIVLVADGTDPNPARRGLLRKCIAPWFTVRYLNEWWSRSTEVNGQPTRVARYNPGDKDMKAELDALLKNSGSSTYMVLPLGVELEFINSITAANTDLYAKLKDSCHEEISIALLGATQTTQIKPNSGSRASSTIHYEVSSNTVNGYALRICATLRDQLVSRLVEWQFSEEDSHRFTPTMQIRVMGYEDMAKLSASVAEFVSSGLPVGQSYVYDASGIPQPDPQEPMMTAPVKVTAPSQSPQNDPASPAQQLERFSTRPKVEKQLGDILIRPYAEHAKKMVENGASFHNILASLNLFALSNGASKAQAKEVVAAYVVDEFTRGWVDAIQK